MLTGLRQLARNTARWLGLRRWGVLRFLERMRTLTQIKCIHHMNQVIGLAF